MRRPDVFNNFQPEAMNSSNESSEIGEESSVDHMMKILRSPTAAAAASASNLKQQPRQLQPQVAFNKTFGVPLAEVVARQNNKTEVPVCVKKICKYIENNGIHREGLFRINGNSKTVEHLRNTFDQIGDADLEGTEDVLAAASLLKLFFRELPDSLIPSFLHLSFVEALEGNIGNADRCVCQLKKLVEQLPEEHFNTLRYLMAFLVRVSRCEEFNRMNPVSLGVMFGPSLFRVSEDLVGLHQQKVMNEVVTKFINHFPAIFEVDDETSDKSVVETSDLLRNDFILSEPLSGDSEDLSRSESSSQNDDIDTMDSSDQTSLDSDSDISSPDSSPGVSLVATEFVEMKITQKLEADHPHKSSELVDMKEDKSICTTVAHGEKRPNEDSLSKTSIEVEDITKGTHSKQQEQEVSGKCRKEEVNSRPNSQQQQQGPHVPDSALPDAKRREWSLMKFDDDYHERKRSMERSQLRVPLQKGCRTKKTVRKSYSLDNFKDENDFADEDSMKENEDYEHPGHNEKHNHRHNKSLSSRKHGKENGGNSHTLDFEPLISAERPCHPFLELHPQPQTQEWTGDLSSPSPSPNASRKPFVPPLDLTILHENCDGNEPIPMNQHTRTSWPMAWSVQEDDEVLLSPRTSHLKKKGSVCTDPNIPPSPPVEQESFAKMGVREDDGAHPSIRQLNKRIHSLKRKIKHFEEKFEAEYGYRPSHSEKMARSDIKKYMTELSKARRNLKQLKEDPLQAGGIRPCDSELGQQPSDSSSSNKDRSAMEDSFSDIILQLTDKRRVAKRPESLSDMNKDQVHDEKVAIQKSLLQFESVFGRPTSKTEKDLMRPIYDRYRSVKRLLSKLGSPKSKDPGTELEPILEHEAMDFIQASPLHRPGGTELKEEESGDESVSVSVSDNSKDEQFDIKTQKKVKKSRHACNLHELTLPELLEQQRIVREEKKRLRRVLREFETEFQRQTGRRIQREDREPLETTYGEYKQVKANLRLLEALLSKHDYHYSI